MHIDHLLELLVNHLKLHAVPQKTKNGTYELTLPFGAQVSLKELDPGLFLSAQIMPIPPSTNKESLWIYLMQANLLGQGTGGGVIGIDPSEKFFLFSLALPYEVNYKVFKESLEDFINYLDYWREEVMRFLS